MSLSKLYDDMKSKCESYAEDSHDTLTAIISDEIDNQCNNLNHDIFHEVVQEIEHFKDKLSKFDLNTIIAGNGEYDDLDDMIEHLFKDPVRSTYMMY